MQFQRTARCSTRFSSQDECRYMPMVVSFFAPCSRTPMRDSIVARLVTALACRRRWQPSFEWNVSSRPQGTAWRNCSVFTWGEPAAVAWLVHQSGRFMIAQFIIPKTYRLYRGSSGRELCSIIYLGLSLARTSWFAGFTPTYTVSLDLVSSSGLKKHPLYAVRSLRKARGI